MIDLLKKLAEKIKSEPPNTKTLQDAGILDENNNFTEHYKNLEHDTHNTTNTQQGNVHGCIPVP